MARLNHPFAPRPPKAAPPAPPPPSPVVASVVTPAPAPLLPPAPAPAVVVSDEPAADYRHATPPWPLNEGDIDLPTEPPPADPAPAPSGLHYLGAVRVHFAGIPGDCDLEVMALPPDQVIIGPLYLDIDQGLRLARQLLAALGTLTRREPRP